LRKLIERVVRALQRSLEIAMHANSRDRGAERWQPRAQKRDERLDPEQNLFDRCKAEPAVETEQAEERDQDQGRDEETADTENMQEVVDPVQALDAPLVIGELSVWSLDLVLMGGLEDMALIGIVEPGARQADLAHGGADVPEHPGGLALRPSSACLDAAELADEGKETAMAQHLGERPVVEPA